MRGGKGAVWEQPFLIVPGKEGVNGLKINVSKSNGNVFFLN